MERLNKLKTRNWIDFYDKWLNKHLLTMRCRLAQSDIQSSWNLKNTLDFYLYYIQKPEKVNGFRNLERQRKYSSRKRWNQKKPTSGKPACGRKRLAESVGFEPTCPVKDNCISSAARYDRFDNSPCHICNISFKKTSGKRRELMERTKVISVVNNTAKMTASIRLRFPADIHPPPLFYSILTFFARAW